MSWFFVRVTKSGFAPSKVKVTPNIRGARVLVKRYVGCFDRVSILVLLRDNCVEVFNDVEKFSKDEFRTKHVMSSA